MTIIPILTLQYINVPLFDAELFNVALVNAALFTVARFNVAPCQYSTVLCCTFNAAVDAALFNGTLFTVAQFHILLLMLHHFNILLFNVALFLIRDSLLRYCCTI